MFIIQPGETFWGRALFRNFLGEAIDVANPTMEIFSYQTNVPGQPPQKVFIMNSRPMFRVKLGTYTQKFQIPDDINPALTYYVVYRGLDCCEDPPLEREIQEIMRIGDFCDIQPDPCLQETTCPPVIPYAYGCN